MVETVFWSALSPLSVNMVLFTVTGAISPVIVNIYTNGSVYTNRCYRGMTHILFYSICAVVLVFITRIRIKENECAFFYFHFNVYGGKKCVFCGGFADALLSL